MMKPLPLVSLAYCLLLNDEKQQVSTSPSLFFSYPSIPINAGVIRNFTYSPRITFDTSGPKPNLVCKYCKKPGYNIDKCCKLHGFPPGFKFTKSLGPRRAVVHAETAPPVEPAVSSTPVTTSPLLGLTVDQHTQLLSLLQQTQLSQPAPDAPSSSLMASAAFAGKLADAIPLSQSCMLTTVDNFLWIIDIDI